MKQVLLFSLDLLLDTRLPVMGRYDPSLPSVIMSDAEKKDLYVNRLNDQFTNLGMPPDVFKTYWDNRDVNDLMNARPTKFLFELSDIAQQLIHKGVMEPHNAEEIEFHINMYPYKDLTEEEREMILAAVKSRVQDWVLFKAVYISDRNLTGEYVRSAGYTGLFLYHFREWLRCHYGSQVPTHEIRAMPSISVYSTLSFDNIDKLQEAMDFRNPSGEGCNPLHGLRAMFAPYFYLEGLELSSLSIIDPNELVKQRML